MKKSWLSIFAASDKPAHKPAAPPPLPDTPVSPSRYALRVAKLDMNEDKKQERYQWLMLQYDRYVSLPYYKHTHTYVHTHLPLTTLLCVHTTVVLYYY